MTDAIGTLTAMIHRYCALFDAARYDEFAALFEHGQWHRAEPGATPTRRWIDQNVILHNGRPGTNHVTTNLCVAVDESADTATANSYVTVYQQLPDFPLQPIFLGRYRDEFARVGVGVGVVWRWTRRRTIGDLYGDISHHVRGRTGPRP